jgi:hypothetical protein
MRYMALEKEEIEILEYLHQNSPNNTVRKRSQCLVLSHQRHKIKDLASIFKVSRRTIERWYDSWAEIGIDSLAIAKGRGAKTLLTQVAANHTGLPLLMAKVSEIKKVNKIRGF